MGKPFLFDPVSVAQVHTENRHIQTKIPVPESVEIIENLKKYEPLSMGGQPLVIWDHAEGVHVMDRYGNKWLDFSSGVLVANAGHGRKEIADAIAETATRAMHHSYCFPNNERAELVKYIVEEVAPDYLDKVFLLTTGSEAVECAIKVSRAFAHKNSGPAKDVVVTFVDDFHGRTLGSQMAGGIPGLKDWIVHHDPNMINAPCPDGFRGKDTSFDSFLNAIKEQNVDPENIACVMLESYQGGSAILLPNDYMKALRAFCDQNKIALIFDEVQAGIGRTGKMFTFEHYGVKADLICMGKGLSSGLPISGVLGRTEMMDVFPPGSMTSTHTGNPVCCAAALANLKLIVGEKLVANAEAMGKILSERIQKIARAYPDQVGCAASSGLVGALQMVTSKGSTDPDHDTTFDIVKNCIERGLMLFGPVGHGGGSVKLAPPLMINEAQLNEGLDVLEEAYQAVCGS